MADMEMVERVARAIDPEAWPADRSSAHWGIRTVRREASIEAARAAIEAMREPTAKMKVRHWTTLEYSGDVRETCHAVWREMIDAILKEGD